jgi:hypothetical protein
LLSGNEVRGGINNLDDQFYPVFGSGSPQPKNS